MYKSLIRPILFKFDPEEVHHFTFSFLKNFGFLAKLFLPKPIEDKHLEREVFGLKFKNPVGLAAGFDKDAKLFNELSDLGKQEYSLSNRQPGSNHPHNHLLIQLH